MPRQTLHRLKFLVKSPKTCIVASELDILCQEAEKYSTQLKELGVDTEVHVYKGSTHWLVVLDGHSCISCC